jgi:regulation of enolase protein 1 (concanavalin A-like superfamily)
MALHSVKEVSRRLRRASLAVAWGLCGLVPAVTLAQASSAFIHPGIGLTIQDLNAVKANLNNAPWSSGYQYLVGDPQASLSYTMQGPFAQVSRNPDVNRAAWDSDMAAIYKLTLMGYFTGTEAYAQKAHDILLAWARTQTSFGGAEAAFEVGDGAYEYGTAADILRGTWSGWTASDTSTVQNYFSAVFWPTLNIPGPLMSGSQGMEQIQGAVAIAIFNDDHTKFNQALQAFIADADSGLIGSYPNGEVIDSGRDQGHAHLYTFDAAWTAEAFWKQGVNVYSLLDNRVLAMGEYYARYNLQMLQTPSLPYIPLGGPIWGLFPTISSTYFADLQDRMATNILYSAYAVRMGVATPWIERLRDNEYESATSFVYLKPGDASTAVVPSMPTSPATTWLTTGLTADDLNNPTPAGNTTFNGGTWTLQAGYNGWDPYWESNDGVQFAYKPVAGDFVFIAKVTSLSAGAATGAKAGVMFRDTLANTTERVWVAVEPGYQYERNIKGWTGLAYGQSDETEVSAIPGVPFWLKMQRTGQRVSTFVSVDGASWSPASVADFTNLPSTIYVGLFGTSHVQGTSFTATFSDVQITGGDGAGSVRIPPAPYSVYASAGAGSVGLRWDSAYEAASYNIKRATSSGGPFSTIATASNNAYTDTGVSNGTTYYYEVTATNAAGESSPSRTDSATPVQAASNLTQAGGTASASSYGYPFTPASAFDGSPLSEWEIENAPTGWLDYDFGSPQTIVSYALASPLYNPTFDPRGWQLLGSNDGTNWVAVDTQSNQTFPYRSMTLNYTVATPGSYRYYRLNITSNNGDASHVQLGELQLSGRGGHTVANGTYHLANRWNHTTLATASAGSVEQATYAAGSASESWTFTDTGSGLYKIVAANGEVLGLQSASAAGWSALQTQADTGASFQRWYLVPSGDGYFDLISASSGMIMTQETSGTERIIQAPDGNTSNQQWSISVLP